MLELIGQSFQNCDRISRRNVLRVGGLALGGATLADLLRSRAQAAERNEQVADTAVIQIFCGGGPSHIDMYDLKPNAPTDIRGEFKEISTNVPGIRICEHLPRQAAIMDKLAIVRTVRHNNATHLPSSHLMQTGYIVPTAVVGRNVHPSTGSVTARVRGTSANRIPTYVAVPRGQAFSYAAYLGAGCNPFTTDIEPNAKNFDVVKLKLPAGITSERVFRRSDLLEQLKNLRRTVDLADRSSSMDRFHRQALDMVTSPRIAEAFDIRHEPDEVRDRYGRTSMGQNCLLARRLVEAGVGYVSCLSGGGWDTHVDNFRPQKELLLPRLDQSISALVADLHERGLNRRVLVNVMGEFGRTPRINKEAGRDHWPGTFCALFAGGGLKMGQMIGTTDSQAAFPTSTPYSPGSVLSTIYHVLGIDYRQAFSDQSGRTFPILHEGEPIPELVS